MKVTKEMTGAFIANAEEHEEQIRLKGLGIYEQMKKEDIWDGAEWFEYEFPDGTCSDCEVWAWDDGEVRVTAYLQYVEDDGFNATDMQCFHPCGMIDYDPSYAYRIPIEES